MRRHHHSKPSGPGRRPPRAWLPCLRRQRRRRRAASRRYSGPTRRPGAGSTRRSETLPCGRGCSTPACRRSPCWTHSWRTSTRPTSACERSAHTARSMHQSISRLHSQHDNCGARVSSGQEHPAPDRPYWRAVHGTTSAWSWRTEPNHLLSHNAGTTALRSSAGGCSLSPPSWRIAQVCPLGIQLSYRSGCMLPFCNCVTNHRRTCCAEEELVDLLQRLLDKLESTRDKVRGGWACSTAEHISQHVRHVTLPCRTLERGDKVSSAPCSVGHRSPFGHILSLNYVLLRSSSRSRRCGVCPARTCGLPRSPRPCRGSWTRCCRRSTSTTTGTTRSSAHSTRCGSFHLWTTSQSVRVTASHTVCCPPQVP